MSSGQRTEPGRLTRPRSLRSRSTIITCSAASLAEARRSAAPPDGRVPLMGIVVMVSPRRLRKQLGRRRDDRPAVACHGARVEWPQRRQPSGQSRWVANERRGEMLHQVDLVDLAGGDRVTRPLDGALVLRTGPGRLPPAHAVGATTRERRVPTADAARDERQAGRFRRVGHGGAAQGGGEPVAQVYVGDPVIVPVGRGPEEALLAEPGVEPLQGVARPRTSSTSRWPALLLIALDDVGGSLLASSGYDRPRPERGPLVEQSYPYRAPP